MVGYVYIVDEILGDGVLDDKIVEVKNTEQNACYLEILRNLCNKNIAPADTENEFDNQKICFLPAAFCRDKCVSGLVLLTP